MRTTSPRISSSAPNAAAVSPLPNDETTPPVTKMYFTGGEVEASRFKRARKSSANRSARLEFWFFVVGVPSPRDISVAHAWTRGVRAPRLHQSRARARLLQQFQHRPEQAPHEHEEKQHPQRHLQQLHPDPDHQGENQRADEHHQPAWIG